MWYLKMEGGRAPPSDLCPAPGCSSLCPGVGVGPQFLPTVLGWSGESVTLTKSEMFPVSPIVTTRGQQSARSLLLSLCSLALNTLPDLSQLPLVSSSRLEGVGGRVGYCWL